MDFTQPAHKDAVNRILAKLRETYGDFIRAYYDGDPIQIPKANLPCVIVEVVEGRTRLAATGQDSLESAITITIAFNKLDDYGADDDKDLTDEKLRRMVEGRDPETGSFLPNSILGVLRSNITLGQTTISNEVDWTYALQPRGEDVTSEARISIAVTERIFVGSRT
jgi:hypothetical protein